MNNPHMSAQPVVPPHNGRRQHEMHYAASPPLPHLPQMYHSYHSYSHGGPPSHYPQPPQQWYPYQQMSMPMLRPYQQYPPMVNAPYPMHNTPTPLPQRPHPPSHVPSSTSTPPRQDLLSPSSSSASLSVPTPGANAVSNAYSAPPSPPLISRLPYYPPLPWYSFTEGTFPPRGPRRRRRKLAPPSSSAPVELPAREDPPIESQQFLEPNTDFPPHTTPQEGRIPQSNLETPSTSHAPSDAESTQPTTPSSAKTPIPTRPQVKSINKSPQKPKVPIVSIVPVIPNISLAPRASKRTSPSVVSDAANILQPSNADHLTNAVQVADKVNPNETLGSAIHTPSPNKAAPKSWADLVKAKVTPASSNAMILVDVSMPESNGLYLAKPGSLADALRSYSAKSKDTKIAFIEPRGLVNTGNMCYMNSVLQMLVFCVPFYDFLDRLSKQAAYSFKSETPLVDAMIMFMREYQVIDSAITVEKLCMRLKDSEIEQYGDAFIPEFVYEVIRRLPRFSSMRRGHQQDAEEFLGFLLEELHDECCRMMSPQSSTKVSNAPTLMNVVKPQTSDSVGPTVTGDHGWLEVGHKQKSAITRSSGMIADESPITKIFGGKLRSELRVPGMKNSVTFEPYQSLQLDIGSLQVSNIIDAMKGLTRSETLHGDFNSPRGPGAKATKQVFIETLPQVLILHLKRFQYDNAGGTQKIWKKVGYPLDLEIPKDVFPQHRRGGILAHGGLPKYRLIGVVYHHGKNASGGHYTVDVRRQDGREWIRLDDTVIRRVRSEDVAEGGNEEDPKVLAAALQRYKNDQLPSSNLYEQIAQEKEEEAQTEAGWSQVNGTASGTNVIGKKWSGIANGSPTPASSSGHRTPVGRFSVRDNKVAYLLFYERTVA